MEPVDFLLIVLNTSFTGLTLMSLTTLIQKRFSLSSEISIAFGVASFGVLGALLFAIAFFALPNTTLPKVISLVIFSFLMYQLWKKYRSNSISKEVALPFCVFIALSIFLLILAHYYNPISAYAENVRMRFSGPLPPDNVLPLLFLMQFKTGTLNPSVLGDWLISDRPPLQTALNMLSPIYAVTGDSIGINSKAYQTFSVGLQMISLLSAYAATKIISKNFQVALASMILVFFMPVTFVNGAFVWPKLLGTSFSVLYLSLQYAYIFNSDRYSTSNIHYVYGIVSGSLVSLALLSHGAQVFAILGIFIVTLFYIRKINYKFILSAAVTCILLYGPWLLFQDKIAPPGDRLLKWHLAGVTEVNSLSFHEVFIAAYASLSFSEFIGNKVANFQTVFLGYFSYLLSTRDLFAQIFSGDFENAISTIKELRSHSFFRLLPSIGLFGVFIYVFPFLIMKKQFRFFVLALYVGVGVWILLIFQAGQTIVHVGSMLPQVLAIVLIAVFVNNKRILYSMCAIAIAFNLLVFVPQI